MAERLGRGAGAPQTPYLQPRELCLLLRKVPLQPLLSKELDLQVQQLPLQGFECGPEVLVLGQQALQTEQSEAAGGRSPAVTQV